ncbi:hypothetical protein F5880DRAFT_28139 [Lentinula raphanica]|nr:hypothetical protein F5880DRAFT_28139 [Lentinula raphanica]
MIILFLVMTHLVTVFFLGLGIASIVLESAFSLKVYAAPTPLGYSINTLPSHSNPRVYVDVPFSSLSRLRDICTPSSTTTLTRLYVHVEKLYR